MDKGRLRAFLKDPLLKRGGEITQLELKPGNSNDRTFNRIHSFKRTL
jgi:hypothetical protein